MFCIHGKLSESGSFEIEIWVSLIRPITRIIRIILFIALIIVTVGFYYPDPYYFANPSGGELILALKLVRSILGAVIGVWLAWEFWLHNRLEFARTGL